MTEFDKPDAQICSIQFSRTSHIRINGIPLIPQKLLGPLKSAIQFAWPQGIQGEKEVHGAMEFNLRGTPWGGYGTDSVNSRRVLASILKCMAENGYTLLQGCDLTRKVRDKDTMFFEYDEDKKDPQASVFALSFNKMDRIRLIPLDLDSIDPRVLSTFTTEVLKGCPQGIQGINNYHGATELKIKRNPWMTSDSAESIATKQLLCHIIRIFRGIGYKLYASVDITTRGTPNITDMESWVFRKVTPQWGN